MSTLRINGFLWGGRAPRGGPDHEIEGHSQPLRGDVSYAASTMLGTSEMTEQDSPDGSFLSRFSPLQRPRPAFSSLFTGRRRSGAPAASAPLTTTVGSGHPDLEAGLPRPASSNYDDYTDVSIDSSPKSARFNLGIPPMPSTRLHVPGISRTWTRGSSGPPSRPGTAHTRRSEERRREHMITPPPPAAQPAGGVPAEFEFGIAETDSTPRFQAVDPSEQHLADLVSEGRRRQRRRHRLQTSAGEEQEGTEARRRRRHKRREWRRATNTDSSGAAAVDGPPCPKHFLFCFPWIKSRRVRSQILRCFVSGSFLTLLLAVYLALSITKNINNSEFSIMLILIVLFMAIFFCYNLVRLCIFLVRPPAEEDEHRRHGAADILPRVYGPGGYAIPREPIRVVLARDEEAAGFDSETTKFNPPAYGLWRESVRVDPDRIYWQRNDEIAATLEVEEEDEGDENNSNGDDGDHSGRPEEAEDERQNHRRQIRRPPSYSSDDGVSYVVEARPRSMAPPLTMHAPLPPHPAEASRAGQPPAW